MDMCRPGDGGGVVSNLADFDAFKVADFDPSTLSCDRLLLLLECDTSSSDDEYERAVFGDMLGVLLFDVFDLDDADFGTCMPRDVKDNDLRRVS
jgi:hypothetical protein